MIAYNKQDLRNAMIQEEAEAACSKECITKDEYLHIKTLYPSRLYTPNPFIRIGLFLLTTLVVAFTAGLLSYMILSALMNEENMGVAVLFYGALCYAALEIFIREKHHYLSGVDDALAWCAAGLILTGCALIWDLDPGSVAFYLLVLVLGAFFAIRFLNMGMGLAAFAGLIGTVFHTFVYALPGLMPFIIMAVSAAVYLGARKYAASVHYTSTLQLLEAAALVMLYLAGNYFIVLETGRDIYGTEGNTMPAGWLFWLLTGLIPLLYIYAGIRKKDKILLRTGLVLIAAIVFTIRYYHSVMPLEVAMVLGGSAMILLAYALIQYLKTPKNGFTNEATDEAETLKGLQIAESLIIAQTFRETPQPDGQFEFGGGTTGGGGAGSDY